MQLSCNNNPQRQLILITEPRASGCSQGQRPSAAYYSHCSPNDPPGLLRISKLSEQVPVRNLQADFCLPRVGVNGKRKLNFSLKFNCFNLELLAAVCVPHHRAFSLLFHFVFLQRFGSPGCLVVPRHPRRAIRASALSFGGTFPRGKSPCLHLGLCT